MPRGFEGEEKTQRGIREDIQRMERAMESRAQQALDAVRQGGGGERQAAAAVIEGIADAQAAVDQRRQAGAIAAQQQLQRDLSEIQRRQGLGFMPFLPAWMQGVGQYNLRNLATRMSELGALDPTALASAQQRIIRDDMGRIIGYRDERGILTGRDPEAERAEALARQQRDAEPRSMVPFAPATAAPEFAPASTEFPSPYMSEPQTYARMGLLDVTPTGLLDFARTYGAGFGTPQDYAAANLAFRMGSGTRPSYYRQQPFLPEYTLL